MTGWRRGAMAAALLLAPAAAGCGEFLRVRPYGLPRLTAVRTVMASGVTLGLCVLVYAVADRCLARPPRRE